MDALHEGLRAGTPPLAFFKRVYRAFQSAARSVGGATDCFYTIGGFAVRLRFAGPALVPFITPALAHLATPPGRGRADLTICLWDSVSTATPVPPRPWEWQDCMARGDVRGFSDTRIHTSLSADVGAVSLLDGAENLGVYWIRDAGHVPTYERAAPLRATIHWWMRRHGRFVVHAGAVGYPEGGVLLVGRGGSGKSTTALASLLAGWRYAGDDYCLLAPDGVPYVHSLYSSAKLNGTHLERLPPLLPAVSNPAELPREKALLQLAQHQPGSLIAGFPVRSILLPRVTGRPETVLTPAASTAALLALAPSSLFQLPGTGGAEFLALADLVRRVPCYHLELGTALDRIPQAVMKVLCQ